MKLQKCTEYSFFPLLWLPEQSSAGNAQVITTEERNCTLYIFVALRDFLKILLRFNMEVVRCSDLIQTALGVVCEKRATI